MNWLARLAEELRQRKLGIRQEIVLAYLPAALECGHANRYRYWTPAPRCKLCRAIARRERMAK